MSESVTSSSSTKSSARWIGLFLLGWTVLNILQAATLGLHSDEAYYWVYSRFLDWGYYDHPPMVALFIRLGDSLWHTELGMRMMTVITSTISMYLLWLIAKKYQASARWFVLIAAGTLAFNIYGFTTTPDAPLLFFTVVFYYVYQQYLERDRWSTALLLGIIVACLLYSKYHSVLLIFFTVLANWKLLKRPSFWLVAVLAAVLYAPHVWWQISHGYPSVNYHLFERSSETYQPEYTYQFIPGQLLMAGPLIGWYLFYFTWTIKTKDIFARTLLFNCIGVFVFFLLNTIKGNVQPHWTLISFVPLLLLTLIRLRQAGTAPRWVYRLAMANAILVIVFRLVLLAQWGPLLKRHPFKSYFGYPKWTKQIKQKAGNSLVIFDYGFQEPSKYNYYTNSLKGFAYDSRYYRRTQYDIWPLEERLQHQHALYVSNHPVLGITTDSLNTVKGTYYCGWVNNIRTYQKIDVQLTGRKIKAKAGQQFTFHLKLANPYPYTVNFNNADTAHQVQLTACFFQGDDLPYIKTASADFNRIVIPSGQSADYNFTIQAPDKKGRYELVFSVQTTPFAGGRNSRSINFTVE